jgi:two-component system, chemotaxis family, chemotaxis protein CheY
MEDNDAAREWLAILLRGEGYQVVALRNGQEALVYLVANPAPDLVLLDMLMPVLDGWHFLEQLRKGGQAAPAPVVITTATIITREWASSHGCAGCLRKPLEAEAVLEEVRRCLRGPQDERGDSPGQHA